MLKTFSTRLVHFAKLWILIALVLKGPNIELNVAALFALPISVFALAIITTACSICQRSLFLKTDGSPISVEAIFWWTSFVLLAALTLIVFPNVIGASYMHKSEQVKANMADLTLVLSRYAHDHGGQYPPDISGEARYYYPEGSPTKHRTGHPPVNPFTNKIEWPLSGKIKSIDRTQCALLGELAMGAVEYSPVATSQGKITDYAIRGGTYYRGACYESDSKSPTVELMFTTASPRIRHQDSGARELKTGSES